MKVGHEDEVDHRDGDRDPRLVVFYRHGFFTICFEVGAQLFGDFEAIAAYVSRLGEDGVHEVARKVLQRGMFCEFVAT